MLKILSIISFILLLLHLWLEIDCLLLVAAASMAVCIVLSFSLKNKKDK